MTKTLLGLIIALFSAVMLSATTVNCSAPPGSGVVTNSGGFNPNPDILETAFTCTLPTVPGGDVITSIQVLILNDYSLGNPISNNQVDYSYVFSGLGFTSTLDTYVLGLATSGGSINPTSGGIINQSGAPTCVNDSVEENECDANGSFSGGSSFTVFGSSNWIEGALAPNGAVDIDVMLSYTYGPDTVAPEPSTLPLVGGLMTLALLAANRRRHA